MTQLIQPSIRILVAALTAALAACGGGSGSTDATPSVPPTGAFAGTAYLKTQNTVLYNGKTYGLKRDAVQGMVDQCNSFRSLFYELPPVSPPEAMLATLDVAVHEKYFDTDKALTLVTGTFLELVDMPRWQKEAAVTVPLGVYPAVPMNCAEVRVDETKSGTLWRDGIKYDLYFNTRRAIGNKYFDDKLPLATASEFAAFPAGKFVGQTCREVTRPGGMLINGKSCIWDLFPFVRYLNWPFALSGRIQFGPSAALVETIEPIEAARNRTIAASVFEIPAGFAVTPP